MRVTFKTFSGVPKGQWYTHVITDLPHLDPPLRGWTNGTSGGRPCLWTGTSGDGAAESVASALALLGRLVVRLGIEGSGRHEFTLELPLAVPVDLTPVRVAAALNAENNDAVAAAVIKAAARRYLELVTEIEEKGL